LSRCPACGSGTARARPTTETTPGARERKLIRERDAAELTWYRNLMWRLSRDVAYVPPRPFEPLFAAQMRIQVWRDGRWQAWRDGRYRPWGLPE
jgi:hypothetical protein